MAGTPVDKAQQAVTGRPEGLLATKFHMPHPPPGCVPRQRLDRRLDDSLGSELTLVSAPAGFGKTTLLAEWCRRRQRPVAWLSLDAGDNDPVRFWRYTVAALDRVRPGLSERVAGLLGSLAPASIEALVTTVVNELAAEGGDALLVLDDYHVVEAQPIHASLRFLLEHQPPALHIVLATRADPPLPLARLRAGGRLAELRVADLVFNLSEAAALLGEAAGLPLGEDLVAELVARTEGWAAGLKLAGLSLPGQPDIARFVESFSGSHRYVLDYLAEEVLEQQPASLRGFMLETSVLDRLSGPLCDAVTGRTDGQQMLQTIEAANLFLTPLDEVRGWWRYHHLFADLLRARLQQQDPERVAELHRRAAAWHHEHGHADDAVGHALAAGDDMRAARLAEVYADEFVVRSETASVQRWLAALPPELVASRPRLLLVRTRIALLAAEVEEVGDLLDAAERAAADVASEPYEWSAGWASSSADIAVFIALGRAWLAALRGDAEAAIVFAERARAELGEGEWMLELLIRWRLALAYWVGGRLSDAERAFGACSGEFARAGELMLSSWSSLLLGQIQCAQGRLDAATETYQNALKLTAPADRPALPAAGFAYVGLGEVAYQRNDLEKALHYATEGIRLCRHLANGQALAVGLATLAQVRQAGGDPSGASDAIKEAMRVGPSATVTSRLNPVPALRAWLLIADGDVDAAARWAAERGIGPDDEPSYPEEAAYLALARVLLAQDQPGQALRMLDRLHALATSGGQAGSVIEIQALRALALSATGDEDAADDALADALALGARQGHVRVFADEGRPMAALLGRYVAAHPRDHSPVPADYLGRLVPAFDAASTAAGPAAVAGLVTQLSTRELEVLRLLAAGKQNQRIADELYVTVYTVKKHVTHILDKLGAANRTEATTRARELGLIP